MNAAGPIVNDGGCCHAKRLSIPESDDYWRIGRHGADGRLGAILVWATKTALEAIKPVFDHLPDKSFGGVSLALLTTVLTIVGSCFVAGLFAETALIRRLVDRAERLALAVPGYALMKNVGANLIGIEGKHPVRTVLVRGEATFQLGFLMETLVDGRPRRVYPGRAQCPRRHAAHRAGRPGADSDHVRHRGSTLSVGWE